MRVQCFGGEYVGEVFDHMLKRMSSRRQKRWWNAYILVYRRQDTDVSSLAMRLNELTIMESKSLESQLVKIPAPIQRSVQVQNIKFMHTKNQFSTEFFQFMKKLLHSNGNIVMSASPGKDAGSSNPTKGVAHEIALTCTQLAARFLFSTCFHTKKSLRGPATEWYEVLSSHLRYNHYIRAWFASHALLSHAYRFCDYLLESPATDVRSAFSKIIVFICHFALQDGVRQVSFSTPNGGSYFFEVKLLMIIIMYACLLGVVIVEAGVALSDTLMSQVLSLLQKEVSEHSRHLAQYFGLFATYAGIGAAERSQLLKLNVPAHFITVSLDEGPGPPIKYQYADFSKLFQVVSILIRSCDVSSKCSPSNASVPILANPFGEEPAGAYLMPLQTDVEDLLFKRPAYVKKLIEDANSTEDTAKLFKFCCWENPTFSSQVLSELLWQIAYSYAYELRPHLDLLLQTLLLEDSWQEHRIHNALKGQSLLLTHMSH
jgi:ubiquitin carboxyl-terminal hydrolase 9/24